MIKDDDVVVIDDDFLSLVEEAEANALSVKRRKIIIKGGGGGGGGGESASASIISQKKVEVEEEGAYTAALKGNSAILDSLNIKSKGTTVKSIANNFSSLLEGGNSENACFKCGQLGHWARDCTATGVGLENPNDGVAEKPCPCGVGTCSVLTANTEKNRGRKFYKCPVREENGGCGFFEWCDNSPATPMSSGLQYSASNSSFPDLPCPCGAGSCLVLTAKSGQNAGQQFYRCPANQGYSCGFFKWCSEHNLAAGPQTSNSNNANNKNYSGTSGSSCFKCGQEGHWARDCPAQPSLPSSVGMGGISASSGTGYDRTSNSNNANNKNYSGTSGSSCFKCGQEGHWARDCPAQPSFPSSVGIGGVFSSSGTGYDQTSNSINANNRQEGHWARDCPAQPSFPSSVGIGGVSSSSGTGYDRTRNSINANNKNYSATSGSSCFKCGQEGHWARDCTAKPSVPSSVGMGGSSTSSGTCFKCGKSGHWARDCPGQDLKFSQGSKNVSASYSSSR